MLEDMVHPQEHLQIDEIIDNIGLQIFDFSDTELSFPETLNIASTSKHCDEDQSSHQTQSSTPTTDKLNNNNNNSSIGTSLNFADPTCNNTDSPLFSIIHNNYDHFQEPLRDDALDETLYSCSEELLTRVYGNNGEDHHQHGTCLSTLMMMPSSSSSYISLGNYSCDVNDPLMGSFNVPLISGILSGNDSVVNGADFAVRGDNYNNNCNNDNNYDGGAACWLSDPVMGVFSSTFNDHQFHSTPSPSTPAISSVDEPNFEVAKLSPEERKRKIDRYINKRNQRNFSKKIKYACRKTLADSRPRVRGRFVKNEELIEFAKTNNNIIMGSSSNNDDEAYENHASTLFPDHPLPEHQHKVVVKVEDRDISDILGNFASNGDQKLKSGAELNKWIMDFVMS